MKIRIFGRVLVDISKEQFIRETTCPGLRQGWWLLGNLETWYDKRPCGKRITMFSWFAPSGGWLCKECTQLARRRGFRTNYESLR